MQNQKISMMILDKLGWKYKLIEHKIEPHRFMMGYVMLLLVSFLAWSAQ